jgi:hypothetical protein
VAFAMSAISNDIFVPSAKDDAMWGVSWCALAKASCVVGVR